MGNPLLQRPSLATGFFYPYRGLRFLFRHPRLLPYAAIPFVINTLIYTGLVWFASSRFGTWLEYLLPQGEAWYWTALAAILWVLFAVGLLVALIYTFTLLGNLILAPFNDFLSEKVEWLQTGHRLDHPFRFADLWKDVSRSLKAELGRLLLYGVLVLALLPLNLLPPIGTAVYGAAFTALTLFFLAWEYMDYSMERWQLDFGTKRKLALGNSGTLLSFGAGAALLLLIPLVNFLAIPVCVIGGTLLICDLRETGRVPGQLSAQNAAGTER